ncbi:ABC-2 type transport system ATP-binding protein [Croceifilum oryzae]|uniref:ABC-2 type transport system ATP-binding protein n=1 Tax=Croceifilum oryzae TaxID=1553429 RepID=A0AAJ1WRW0_9BACL|nr:ATP-binding cassette domain-containing protein [Croceifilum oryzae]MDQ0418932.1 ABC-2 type transport system ATP-binding protein [Croceifilum oryzae]
MLAIEAKKLTKEFQVYQSRKGLSGAFRDLLNREYRTIRAVNEIDLSIEPGEMVGYIGENGAGKSTTIKMLTGILQPTSGMLKVNGYDPHREREKFVRTIGVVFGQRSQLWWDLAVQESFQLLQKVYRIPQEKYEPHLKRMIDVLNIQELLDQPVRKLSLGQRMRCELATSLIHQPSLLFLDEPTIGLDVLVKEDIRQFLRDINQELNTTVLLTTHDLGDIEALCSRVVMLDKGNIIYDGDMNRLKREWGDGKRIVLETEREYELSELQATTEGLPVEWEKKATHTYEIKVPGDQVQVPEVLGRVIAQGIAIQEMQLEEATAEEIVRKIYQEGMTLD